MHVKQQVELELIYFNLSFYTADMKSRFRIERKQTSYETTLLNTSPLQGFSSPGYKNMFRWNFYIHLCTVGPYFVFKNTYVSTKEPPIWKLTWQSFLLAEASEHLGYDELLLPSSKCVFIWLDMSMYTNIFFNETEERHDTVMFHCIITDRQTRWQHCIQSYT